MKKTLISVSGIGWAGAIPPDFRDFCLKTEKELNVLFKQHGKNHIVEVIPANEFNLHGIVRLESRCEEDSDVKLIFANPEVKKIILRNFKQFKFEFKTIEFISGPSFLIIDSDNLIKKIRNRKSFGVVI